MAEFLLDMYLFQGDSSYLDLARKDFGSLMLYATRRPEGTTFPGEELIRLSSDFGTGAAGVGSFLQRLESLQHRKLFDFNPQFYEHSRGGLEHIA